MMTGLETFWFEYSDQNAEVSPPRDWSPSELCGVIERCAGQTLVNLSLTFSLFRYGDTPTVPIRSLRGFQKLKWLEVQAFVFFEEPNFYARNVEYIEKHWVEPKADGQKKDSSMIKPVDHDSIQHLRGILPASLHILRLHIQTWIDEACVMFEDFEIDAEERLPCLQLVEVACHHNMIPPLIS